MLVSAAKANAGSGLEMFLNDEQKETSSADRRVRRWQAMQLYVICDTRLAKQLIVARQQGYVGHTSRLAKEEGSILEKQTTDQLTFF